MSKPWNPGRQTVELRPSRIRRDPVRLDSPAGAAKTPVHSREREMWGGVTGILLFAAAVAVVIVGIGAATYSRYDPAAAARLARFGQCYNSQGPNCVIDGDTIVVARQRVEIAGMEAPKIRGARCETERSRGIEAALRLEDLLNSGEVTVVGPVRDSDGQVRTRVEVAGRNAGAAMVAGGWARKPGTGLGWCGASD